MKRIVERHEPTYHRTKEEYTKFILDRPKQLEVLFGFREKENFEKWNLSGIASSISSNIGYVSFKIVPVNYLYNYLYYYNQLQYALFMSGMNEGKKVQFQIADRAIETVGKSMNLSSYGVKTGIETSKILRDKQKLDFFSSVPVEVTEKGNQEDLVGEILMLFYQILIKGNGTKNEAIATYHHLEKQLDWNEYVKYVIQEGFNDEYVWKQIHKYRSWEISHKYLPVVNIYHHILNNNQLGFEDAVCEALLKWKEYYLMKYTDENQEERDHSTEPSGFLALPVIAACAYAYDRGMQLQTVESDYLCDWMIEGRFEGFELLVKG